MHVLHLKHVKAKHSFHILHIEFPDILSLNVGFLEILLMKPALTPPHVHCLLISVLFSPVEEQSKRQPVFGPGTRNRQHSHHVPLSWYDTAGQWALILLYFFYNCFIFQFFFSPLQIQEKKTVAAQRDITRDCQQ